MKSQGKIMTKQWNVVEPPIIPATGVLRAGRLQVGGQPPQFSKALFQNKKKKWLSSSEAEPPWVQSPEPQKQTQKQNNSQTKPTHNLPSVPRFSGNHSGGGPFLHCFLPSMTRVMLCASLSTSRLKKLIYFH